MELEFFKISKKKEKHPFVQKFEDGSYALFPIRGCPNFSALSVTLKFSDPLKGSEETFDFGDIGSRFVEFLKGSHDLRLFTSTSGLRDTVKLLFDGVNIDKGFIRMLYDNLVKLQEVERLTDTVGGSGGQFANMPTQGGNCYVDLDLGKIVKFTNYPDSKLDSNNRYAKFTLRIAHGENLGEYKLDTQTKTIVSISAISQQVSPRTYFGSIKATKIFHLAIALFNLEVDPRELM